MTHTPPRINTFSHYSRKKFGKPVGKVALDLGIACPNRKQGGCIYCRPASFTPGYLDKNNSIDEQLELGKAKLLKGRFNTYFAYFQQETCTAQDPDEFCENSRRLLAHEQCRGLILSTRPDAVPDGLLGKLATRIERSGKECLIELGLQTIHPKSLALLNRNHTLQDFTEAVTRIRSYQCFSVGAHLIFGIPGESDRDMISSVRYLSELSMDSLKLHHLQVIRDTPLEQMYNAGLISTLSLDHYLDLLLRVLPEIPAQTVIHRLWASSHPDILIAPKWNILTTHLSRKLLSMMEEQQLFQGQNCQ